MRRTIFVLAVGVGLCLWALAPAQASPSVSELTHGRPIVTVGANQSNNWSGYNQGTLEKANKMFTSITGDWTVPTATAKKSGEAEYSSSWIGIGGGCVDAGCTITDSTLIQAGTEQDVDSNGKATYSAWWELIPAPSVTISGMTVKPGDHMHVAITENPPMSNVWTIEVDDLTAAETFTQTQPYTSTHATAEWIEETPVVVDSGGNVSVGPLPNLSTVHFDVATTNGANAALVPSEEMQLVDFNGTALATPSAPDADTDGFNDCAYASSCPVPTSDFLTGGTTTTKGTKHHTKRSR